MKEALETTRRSCRASISPCSEDRLGEIGPGPMPFRITGILVGLVPHKGKDNE